MAPRVAIVHDYLTQRGGAERVALAMARAFPGAEVLTSLHDPATTFPGFDELRVRESYLARVPGLRTHHRLGLLAYPSAFRRLRPDADVVVCSSSGWAHGIGGDAPKVVYCYTPARWLYRTDDFAPSAATRATMAVVGPALRRWDRSRAHAADRYLTTAPGIAARIKAVYGIEAEVLPPPLTLDPAGPQEPLPGVAPGYALCVARLLAYKHVDLVVAAARHLPDLEVVVVGEGPEKARLRAAAPANVRFVDVVTDPELRWLYAHAAVLVAAALEDYGLTPLEAAAFGVPTVARRGGGYLVTVLDGITGRLVDEPTAASLAEAIGGAAARRWDPAALRRHANDGSEAAFARRLREVVEEVASGQ